MLQQIKIGKFTIGTRVQPRPASCNIQTHTQQIGFNIFPPPAVLQCSTAAADHRGDKQIIDQSHLVYQQQQSAAALQYCSEWGTGSRLQQRLDI